MDKKTRAFLSPKKLGLLCALFLGLVAGSWYFMRPVPSSPPQQKIVEVHHVKKMPLQQITDLLGTIRSGQQTSITSKGSGRLDCLVSPGTTVPKDALIARIDNASLAQTYALSKKLEALSEKQLDRAVSLLASGFASKKMLEDKKSDLLEAQKKRLDAKIALEALQVKAPFDGTVGIFKKRNGSQVSPGEAILDFYDPNSTIVELEVPASICSQIQDGAQVVINNKYHPLTHVQKMLDEDTHMCPAYLEVSDLEGIIGTTLSLSLVSQHRDSVIAIPFEALFLKDGRSFVYLIKDNKVELAAVELGLQQKDQIEITKGLKEGDQLVVFGHSRLSPGESVEIASKDPHTQKILET